MPVDQDTELPDRAALDDLHTSLSVAAPASTWPVSVLLIDLDRFRELNESFGFEAGDQCLQELARLFASQAPLGSTVGRFGGDEFLVVLPSTTLDDAAVVAASLRASVGLRKETSAVPLTTVSIGVATASATKNWAPRQLLHIAELRLVVAKKRLQTSRNCIWAAGLPPGWLSTSELEWPSQPGQPRTGSAP